MTKMRRCIALLSNMVNHEWLFLVGTINLSRGRYFADACRLSTTSSVSGNAAPPAVRCTDCHV